MTRDQAPKQTRQDLAAIFFAPTPGRTTPIQRTKGLERGMRQTAQRKKRHWRSKK
jgi:hypothetical protein